MVRGSLRSHLTMRDGEYCIGDGAGCAPNVALHEPAWCRSLTILMVRCRALARPRTTLALTMRDGEYCIGDGTGCAPNAALHEPAWCRPLTILMVRCRALARPRTTLALDAERVRLLGSNTPCIEAGRGSRVAPLPPPRGRETPGIRGVCETARAVRSVWRSGSGFVRSADATHHIPGGEAEAAGDPRTTAVRTARRPTARVGLSGPKAQRRYCD